MKGLLQFDEGEKLLSKSQTERSCYGAALYILRGMRRNQA